MAQDIKIFVVSIRNRQGENRGTGFVIGKRTLVTCAHVVTAADADVGETVKVKLPGVDEMLDAEVWHDGYHFNNDVAILTLPEDLPDNIKPAILGNWQDAVNTGFRSFGYRPLGRFQGVPAEGRILDQVLEVNAQPSKPVPTQPVLMLASQQISPGMSGSPVYAPSIDRVVGMITAIWNSPGRDRDTAFAIAAGAIVEAWSGISLQPPGESVSLSPLIPELKPPWELEYEEYLEDYDFLQSQIAFLKQELRGMIDPTMKFALQHRLERLNDKRRALYQKIDLLRQEINSKS